MSRVERHPGTFGVQRPNRSVSVGQAWADALLARAQQGNPGVGGRPDLQVPGWASNAVNSAVGQIAGQPSLGDMQTAFAEQAAQGVSMTPAAIMQQQRLAGGIDEALDWVRPLALADLGVAGAAGRAMIPIPGALAPGAAPAARTTRRVGGGIAGALRQLLGRGADEAVSAVAPVVRETTEAAGRTSRQTFRNIEDLSDAAQPAWEGGPTIVHGSPSELADGFASRNPFDGKPLGGRSAMGTGLYTTPTVEFALRYADEATQKAIKVGNKSGATTGVFPTTASLGDMPPGFVHNVRFTGDGAPVLLDYGANGIDQKAKDAVMGSLDDLDDLLRPFTGTTLVSDRQRRFMQHWLDDPKVSFGALHGYTSEGGTGGLRRTVEDVISTNIRTGPFAEGQKAEMMSKALENLSIRLRDAGYHGYVSPQGGSFQQDTLLSKFGQKDADLSGGMISWFTPERDLAIMGSAPYGGAGTTRAFRR